MLEEERNVINQQNINVIKSICKALLKDSQQIERLYCSEIPGWLSQKMNSFLIFAYQIEKKLSLVFLILCVLFSIKYNNTKYYSRKSNQFFSFGVTSNFICNHLEQIEGWEENNQQSLIYLYKTTGRICYSQIPCIYSVTGAESLDQ